MTDAEYIETQQQLLLLANIVSQMDLADLLERIQHGETVGPILDPTLFIRGSKKLSAVKRIAQGAQQFQKAIAEAKEELADEVLPR
ncbi:MAG: hypothetical protein ACM3ZU_08165 [Bacteroidota bacterium]